MNVGQLIERLREYPQDLRVVVNGYEGGYNDVDQFQNVKIVLHYNDAWYYGEHEDVSIIHDESKKSKAVEALRIG